MVKRIIGKSYIWLILLVMYAPILTLFVFSFTESKNIGSWTGFSFNLYLDMFIYLKTIYLYKEYFLTFLW